MWYFAWILGLGLACTWGILNAMWYELYLDDQAEPVPPTDTAGSQRGEEYGRRQAGVTQVSAPPVRT